MLYMFYMPRHDVMESTLDILGHQESGGEDEATANHEGLVAERVTW